MYWKLVTVTDFDANFEMYSAKSIDCVIMAPSKENATAWFKYLDQKGVINFKSYCEVEPATQDEYITYMNNITK